MALHVGQTAEETTRSRGQITLTERIYRTRNGDLVREGDARAHVLYRGLGKRITLEEAVQAGVVSAEPEEAQSAKPAAKTKGKSRRTKKS